MLDLKSFFHEVANSGGPSDSILPATEANALTEGGDEKRNTSLESLSFKPITSCEKIFYIYILYRFKFHIHIEKNKKILYNIKYSFKCLRRAETKKI